MTSYAAPTIEELAPNWHRLVGPAIRAAGVPPRQQEDAEQDFLVYVMDHDLLGRWDPLRMPLDRYLHGYARKFALRSRESALGFGYELTLDDPAGVEPGADDPLVESTGSLDDLHRLMDWLDSCAARRPHAELLRAWISEVFSRDQVNCHRIAQTLGWSTSRVLREMRGLREAGRHFGV